MPTTTNNSPAKNVSPAVRKAVENSHRRTSQDGSTPAQQSLADRQAAFLRTINAARQNGSHIGSALKSNTRQNRAQTKRDAQKATSHIQAFLNDASTTAGSVASFATARTRQSRRHAYVHDISRKSRANTGDAPAVNNTIAQRTGASCDAIIALATTIKASVANGSYGDYKDTKLAFGKLQTQSGLLATLLQEFGKATRKQRHKAPEKVSNVRSGLTLGAVAELRAQTLEKSYT